MNTKIHVLILDETESNLLFFESLLTQIGDFAVYTSTAPADAEEQYIRYSIDLVICAWELQGMPGTAFVQRIKMKRKSKSVPFIIYSKRMSEQDISLLKDLGLANILAMPFDKAKAEALINEVVERAKMFAPIEQKIQKIEEFVSEGRAMEALRMVDSSITKKSPLRPRVKTVIAEIWLMLKKYDKAEESLKQALAEDPAYWPAKSLSARLMSLTGQHEQAIAQLEELVAASPANIQALLSLGNAQMIADRDQDAARSFAKAQKIDGENQDIKDEQAKLAVKTGDIDLAATLLAQTDRGDQLARDFNNMAIACVSAKQFERGIEIYSNAIKLLSNKSKVHLLYFNMGLAYKKKGAITDAFAAFCQSYLTEPTYEKAYATLAATAKELKQSGAHLDKNLVTSVKETRARIKPVSEGHDSDPGEKAS